MSCRILVVEDEALIAEDLKLTISDLGHEVVGSIDNGLGAISLTKTLLPDIIFMDVNLSGTLDGIETAISINAIVEKKIAFIFVTSHFPENHHLINKLFDKKIWIQKPYTAIDVKKAIEQSH